MALPECFAYHSEADNAREHADHEFNARFDRYDGWGDREAANEAAAYDDWYEEKQPVKVALPVIDPNYLPAEEGDIPF